jgi:hypothetical protein
LADPTFINMLIEKFEASQMDKWSLATGQVRKR